MDLATAAGMLVGLTAAPWVALGALARGTRVFHPLGDYYRATVHPLATDGPVARFGARLAGEALVRFSTAGKADLRDDQRDILGLTLRFHATGATGLPPEEGDQDLLFANFRSLGSAGEDAKLSNTRNLLDNTFHTATPSRDPDLGAVTWRVVPTVAEGEGDNGFSRLQDVVAREGAVLTLQFRGEGDWTDALELRLAERLDHLDADTHFSPFRTGRGIVPYGFVTGIRKVVYPVGRAVRG